MEIVIVNCVREGIPIQSVYEMRYGYALFLCDDSGFSKELVNMCLASMYEKLGFGFYREYKVGKRRQLHKSKLRQQSQRMGSLLLMHMSLRVTRLTILNL